MDKIFLEGIIETAKTAKEKFRKVVELTKRVDDIISNLNVKYDNAKKVIEYFYNEQISSRKKVADSLEMPQSTLNGVISELQRVGILNETTGYARNQLFVFKEYVDIFLS